MPLRRYQPVVRGAQWRDTISVPDPRTQQLINLTASTLVLGLFRCDDAPSRFGWGYPSDDYGWPFSSTAMPVLRAQTQPDGSGSLQILPDGLSAQFFFTPAQTIALCPGEHVMIVGAYIGSQGDEILRESIPVLAGPALPAILAPVL